MNESYLEKLYAAIEKHNSGEKKLDNETLKSYLDQIEKLESLKEKK